MNIKTRGNAAYRSSVRPDESCISLDRFAPRLRRLRPHCLLTHCVARLCYETDSALSRATHPRCVPPSKLAPLVTTALHPPTPASTEIRATDKLHIDDLCATP
jgi:hypothetical protein